MFVSGFVNVPKYNNYESNYDYSYGFQGQEMDNEIKGVGNSLNYKYRMHDPRLGRFFAVDPLTKKYPELTPYQFSSNNPIGMIEIEGLEGIKHTEYDDNGKVIRHVVELNIAVVTVDEIDKDFKRSYIEKHGRKAWRKLKNKRIESYYKSEDIEEIKSILTEGYSNQKNSKGERVDFVFHISELHISSTETPTRKELEKKAKYLWGEHSAEKLDRPYKARFNGKIINVTDKISPLNLMIADYPPEDARGWNNNISTFIYDNGNYLSPVTIKHETAHQFLTMGKKGAEHKLISEYDFNIDSKVVDQILKDAYEKKDNSNSNNN